MNIKTQAIGVLVGVILMTGPVGRLYAACAGTAQQSANFCLYQSGQGTVGGNIQSSSYKLLATNAYPYQTRSSAGELTYWRKEALADLAAGEAYRSSLMLLDASLTDGSARARMLKDRTLNYQDVGLLKPFGTREAGLIQARDTFAYHLYLGYSDQDLVKLNLLDTVRTLANLYVMVADEFLVDALEWRFPADTVGVDAQLDKQIELLTNAQSYYEHAVAAFVSGFSPAVGTNIYISDYFDSSVDDLFNLAVQRLSLALREKSSRQLVRQMAPDSEQWSEAWKQTSESLKSGALSIYLTSAARAARKGANFDNSASALAAALNTLRKQGNIYNQQLNPLGYDNRYIPATDFERLHGTASGELTRAVELENAFKTENREFDYIQSKLETHWNTLAQGYIQTLAVSTGCTAPNPLTDKTQLNSFNICTGEAGTDLFDCRLGVSQEEFDNCVSAKKTKGILASKYSNIMDAQIRLNAAILHRENILKSIEYENEAANQLIEIQNLSASATTAKMNEYLPKLRNAVKIVNTTINDSGLVWDGKKWIKKSKPRDHKTEKSFAIRDDELALNTQRENELREITLNFQIQQINLDTQTKVKNLLLNEAEAEIELQLAVHQKNSAIAEFDSALQEKENLWNLYQQALAQADPVAAQVAPARILRSQSAIALSEALNSTAHYAYLAAKALEYRHVTSLEKMPTVTGLSLRDVFKAQTTADLSKFISNLSNANQNQCPWGAFSLKKRNISIRDHVLGFGGDTTRFQGFISDHINAKGNIQFSFSISEDAPFLMYFGLYNVKIWEGPFPPSCGSSEVAKGTAVQITGTGLSGISPMITLKKTGHSSLRDPYGQINQYIPVYDSHFLFESKGDYIPSTSDLMAAFTRDPRTDTTAIGDWSPAFKGGSISSSDWEVTVHQGTTNFTAIEDIWLYFDVSAKCCLSN
jgi:hypothetical protein